jgi:hypothetical protein
MVTTVAQAIKALEQQTLEDPDLADAVVFLAQGADSNDPFGPAPEGALAAARRANARLLRTRRTTADQAALDTSEVVALLQSVNDRRGVDRRRQRGQLLAWKSGAQTLHPKWQFDARRGEVWPGLPIVLKALAEVAPDPQAADELMRAPRVDLAGASLADLVAKGRPETAARLIRSGAEQA